MLCGRSLKYYYWVKMLPGKVKFQCFEKVLNLKFYFLFRKDKVTVICNKIIMIFSYRLSKQAKIIGEIVFGENYEGLYWTK